MADPVYVVRADIEAQFTPDQVRRAFTDDGATFNDAAFAAAAARASRVADSILAKAWPDPVQRADVAGDDSVKACVGTLVMHYGLSRRPEYRGADGLAPFAADAKEARADLEAMAAGELRPDVSADAAKNTNVSGRLNRPVSPSFMFAPSVGRPDPRGY
jgi:hypothetical protein